MKSLKYIIGKDTKFGKDEIHNIRDLEDGDIVELRNYDFYLYEFDKRAFYNLENGLYIPTSYYNTNMTSKSNEDLDIIIVWRIPGYKYELQARSGGKKFMSPKAYEDFTIQMIEDVDHVIYHNL